MSAVPDFSNFPDAATNNKRPADNRSQSLPVLQLSGSLSSLSQFSLPPLGSYSEQWQVVKLENRVRLEAALTYSGLKTFALSDFYNYADLSDPSPPRPNGFLLRQLWIEYSGKNGSVRIGKQLLNWGNADLFPVVNTLDRPDLRDLSVLDRSQRYTGSYSVNSKFFIGNSALEAVWIPVFQQTETAPSGTFWYFDHDDIGGFTVTETVADKPSADLKNGAFALRWGGNLAGSDLHINYYYGAQRGLLLQSFVNGTGITNAAVTKKPKTSHVHLFSIDAAFTAGKTAFRFEIAYSPGMSGVEKPTADVVSNAAAGLDENSTGAAVNSLHKKRWLGWTVGMDWQLWGDDGRILLEWSGDRYLEQDNRMEPFRTSDLLAVMGQDTFINGKLVLQLGGVFTRREGEYLGAAGYTITVKPGSNFSFTHGTFFFAGICYLQVKYNF